MADSASTLPAGVTLRATDGGPNYYANSGFTYAVNAGWDSPNFFPIGLWLPPMLSQSDADRWHDLGLNTAFVVTANSSLSLLRSNGFWLVGETGGPLQSGYGAETVALLGADENWSASVAEIKSTPNSVQDGRPWWLQNTWSVEAYGDIGGVGMATRMSEPHPTPNGTTRHFDLLSADTYWFTGSKDGGMLWSWGQIYNLGRPMTEDEGARGSHYGDMVDILRSYQPTYPAPIAQFIETGEPGNAGTDADYITPPELNWAAWSSIIHGAREIIYFNHTFTGSHQSQDNLAQPFYQTIQPGQTISIYDQVKATDGLIAQLAPVINSPFALDYATVDGPHYSFGTSDLNLDGGIEVMAKDYNGQFYIFADTRDSETQHNIQATYHLTDPAAVSVDVVNENRTIAVTNGVFTDSFANASTVHIYHVNDSGTPPPPTGTVSISDASITEGNSGTQTETFTLTRSGGTAPFDVNYATADGTATVAGGDFFASSGTFHFAQDQLTGTVSVTIVGDTNVEPNETFNVNLSSPTNGVTIADGTGVGTIVNDDNTVVAGSISINDVTSAEGNSGTHLDTFTVTRTGGTAAFDINYATSNGTATSSDSDYVAKSGILHFGSGINTQTVSVTVNGDTKVETNETFNVTLSGPTNGATISDGQGVGTIVNDDSASSGNIVKNGGFETGNFSSWKIGHYQPEQTIISPNAHSGQFAAALGPAGGLGSLSQDIVTTPGEHYTLDFWLANMSTARDDFKALWGGTTELSLHNAPAQGYTEYTFDVVATSTKTHLEFDYRQDPTQWRLDDISVTHVNTLALHSDYLIA